MRMGRGRDKGKWSDRRQVEGRGKPGGTGEREGGRKGNSAGEGKRTFSL